MGIFDEIESIQANLEIEIFYTKKPQEHIDNHNRVIEVCRVVGQLLSQES
jgi:hypothetical protein